MTWQLTDLETAADLIMASGEYQDPGEAASREELIQALDEWLAEVVEKVLSEITYYTYDSHKLLPRFSDALHSVQRRNKMAVGV